MGVQLVIVVLIRWPGNVCHRHRLVALLAVRFLGHISAFGATFFQGAKIVLIPSASAVDELHALTFAIIVPESKA